MANGPHRVAIPLAVLMAVGAAACSTTPPPREQLAVSRQAIDDAQAAGAARHAPVELASARDKFEAAQRAANDEQNVQARMLAEQAEADAALAAARARSTQSKQAVAEVRESIRTLREELDRRPVQ